MKLSRMTDYAVTITTVMARAQDRVHPVAVLSASTGLTESTVSQIVKKLAREGLLVSVRGASGGYKLAMRADVMTMLNVLEAMEGPIALTRCLEVQEKGSNGPACAIEEFCGTKSSWAKVNDAVKQALGDLTLADVAGGANNKKVVNIK